MTSDHIPPQTAGMHRNRSVGLIIFGAAEILIGLVCAALIPLTLVVTALSPMMEGALVLSSLTLYGIGAAIFITLGVGSSRARCWAQALSLSLSWVWLLTGVCSLVFLWWILPDLWLDLGSGSGLDAGDAKLIAVGLNLFFGVIYVVLPGAFVLFYRSPDVIATCKSSDPNPGWADRCPQRLLALAVAYGIGGLSVISAPSYGYAFPLFGLLLSGAAGAACWALVLLLSGVLAWGTARRQAWAWWTGMAAGAAAGLSSAITFAGIDPDELFEIEGLPSEQRWLLETVWPASPWVHVALQAVIWGSLLADLAFVRPLFNPPVGRGASTR